MRRTPVLLVRIDDESFWGKDGDANGCGEEVLGKGRDEVEDLGEILVGRLAFNDRNFEIW